MWARRERGTGTLAIWRWRCAMEMLSCNYSRHCGQVDDGFGADAMPMRLVIPNRFSQPNGNGHGEMAMVGCRHGKNTDGDGW
ncbi:GD12192 [Drosophila simulans]|uniref:GD12192 n=1 Tax=Drosophila simulans TaxID=7240 RepID=B4QRY7_DROSI|nr:GD12192 [Drosophila simulans]